MRKDMGKCVIERPRRGSHWRCAKARSFGRFVKDDEGNIEYEGITRIPTSWKKYGWDHREFTDVLGPIQRYLRSSCGRLWNDVYSEIAQVLGNAGYALGHIITDHLDVEEHTFRGADGNVWYCKDGVWPITHSYRHTQFYVEPETGILRSIEPRRWRSWQAKQNAPAEPLEVIKLGDREEYRKINGIWYHRTYELTEEVGPINEVGKYFKHPERDRRILVLWERKRQLGKKQLKELGLKNG